MTSQVDPHTRIADALERIADSMEAANVGSQPDYNPEPSQPPAEDPLRTATCTAVSPDQAQLHCDLSIGHPGMHHSMGGAVWS